MSIIIENLSHTYMEGTPFSSRALYDINLTIEDGEFIGLLGHTGSGKSTLVQHLNGLLAPSGGRILIDGEDLHDKRTTLSQIRRKIGLVFQYPEYQLFEETVEKDIAFGPKNMGLADSDISARVKLACQQVGLSYEDVAQRSPFELSGGQMRRVAIAGVLAMQPKILVLDEPTAGLDPSGRKSILHMIRTLHATTNITIVMISHSMDDIASLATRLVVMSKGTIALMGEPRTLFAQEEALQAIGLDVPQAARLAHRLQALGYAIPPHLFTVEEVRDAIFTLWNKGVPSC